MKYLIPILTLLWLLLLTCAANNMAKELSDLKTMDTLHSKKIKTLEDTIDLCAKEKKALIVEVREIMMPFHRVIVLDRGILLVRDEEKP